MTNSHWSSCVQLLENRILLLGLELVDKRAMIELDQGVWTGSCWKEVGASDFLIQKTEEKFTKILGCEVAEGLHLASVSDSVNQTLSCRHH